MKLMFYVPSGTDMRCAELQMRGQNLLRAMQAKKAEAWRLCFRRHFRPAIRVPFIDG